MITHLYSFMQKRIRAPFHFWLSFQKYLQTKKNKVWRLIWFELGCTFDYNLFFKNFVPFTIFRKKKYSNLDAKRLLAILNLNVNLIAAGINILQNVCVTSDTFHPKNLFDISLYNLFAFLLIQSDPNIFYSIPLRLYTLTFYQCTNLDRTTHSSNHLKY